MALNQFQLDTRAFVVGDEDDIKLIMMQTFDVSNIVSSSRRDCYLDMWNSVMVLHLWPLMSSP